MAKKVKVPATTSKKKAVSKKEATKEAPVKAAKKVAVKKEAKPSKYEYPEGMTSDERKKFRTKQRAAAIKAEKGDAPAKPSKKKAVKVKAEKADEPVKATKKKAKAKKPVTTED